MGSQVHMYGDEGRGPKDVWLVVSRGVFVYIRLHILHVPVWAAPCPHVTRIPYNSRRSSGGARPTSQSSEAGRNTPAVISRCDLSDTPSTGISQTRWTGTGGCCGRKRNPSHDVKLILLHNH